MFFPLSYALLFAYTLRKVFHWQPGKSKWGTLPFGLLFLGVAFDFIENIADSLFQLVGGESVAAEWLYYAWYVGSFGKGIVVVKVVTYIGLLCILILPLHALVVRIKRSKAL